MDHLRQLLVDYSNRAKANLERLRKEYAQTNDPNVKDLMNADIGFYNACIKFVFESDYHQVRELIANLKEDERAKVAAYFLDSVKNTNNNLFIFLLHLSNETKEALRLKLTKPLEKERIPTI